jgi:hypothetical protein
LRQPKRKQRNHTNEKEVNLRAVNRGEVYQLSLKVQFYQEKLKLKFLQLLTNLLEKRLQKSGGR